MHPLKRVGLVGGVSQGGSHLFYTLDEAKLKEKGRTFHDLFLTKLSLLLKGTVVAPPEKFGETLQDERVNGGAFVGTDGLQFPQKLIPNAGMRLYGGAQYHRAMAEFRFVVGGIKCPPITREEIVNACGVEDIHDGTNYSRTACVIAVAKARDTFEPFLHQVSCICSPYWPLIGSPFEQIVN
ncbi:Dynamin-like protein ARC5 [Vitis vinifera]|uniref:Dynamin-like protein ARC5 n=1 Tax=Vitis vinifera TaxID=29760 RepID=A0A438E2Z4_VITVI|nr:Dynamin-like protein ARC5 [Vitis vinifera]